MTTPLGISFSTNKNAVAQADVQLLGEMAESLVVEFDPRKFEEFLSLGSASPKAIGQYRKVSSETCSQISSGISPKVSCTTAHNASSPASNDVLKTSRVAQVANVNIPQGTRKANTPAHDQSDGEEQFRHPSLQTPQFKIAESFQ